MNATLKHCPSCGKQLPGEARFCAGCGIRVEEVASVSIPNAASRPGYTAPQAIRAPMYTQRRPDYSFRNLKVAGTGFMNWSRAISAVLAILLALTTIIGIARGAFYNAVSGMSVEKLYDTVYDEYGKDNPLEAILEELVHYGNGVRIDDAIEFLNTRKVKNAIQKALNSGIDMILTGDPKKLASEDDVRRLVKSVRSEIGNKLGESLSKRDIDNVTTFIIEKYLGDFYSESNRHKKQMIEDFWEYEAPDGLAALRPLLHPSINTILTVLTLLTVLGLLFLNRRQISRVLKLIGIPLIISGALALVLSFARSAWANLILDETDISVDVAKILLSGYSGTARRFMLWFLLIGICMVVLNNAMSHKNN